MTPNVKYKQLLKICDKKSFEIISRRNNQLTYFN